MEIKLNPYQAEFLDSKKRFPGLIAGIGTGKTFMFLLKIWQFCEFYKNSLALIVRKEFTDLKDSTMVDFEKYFNVKVNARKDYDFQNGSKIMFRHGAEMNVLKNINLTLFGIEQAEEFEDDKQFIFLRDRLRNQSAPIRQGIIIANANGHNWVYDLWVRNKGNNPNFHCITARTFDNEHNLPKDFTDDLRRMEVEAPNHYRQYILNDFEVTDADDMLFELQDLNGSMAIEVEDAPVSETVLGVDIARYGADKCVMVQLDKRLGKIWEVVKVDAWNSDLMASTGRILDAIYRLKPDKVIVDGDGIGAGVVDRLREVGCKVIMFRGGAKSEKAKNMRSEAYFTMQEMIKTGYLKILNDENLIRELLTIRFSFTSKGERFIIPKEIMRKDNIKSPDFADALMMACSATKVKGVMKRNRFNGEALSSPLEGA